MISGRSLIGIGMCALVSLVGSNTVFGETSTPSTTERVAALETRTNALEEKTTAPGLWKTLGFQLSGGISASYNHNFNNPNTNLSQLYTHNANTNTFTPNLAQLMLQRAADPEGRGAERAGFRARLNFGSDARTSRARTNYLGGTSNDEIDVQELYAEYIVPGTSLKINAGKMNTLLGYETFTSWENPNFMRTFNYNLAQAFTNTGLRLTYVVSPMATMTAAVYNGWDNIDDNNKGKIWEGSLTLTLHPRIINYFYGSWGPEQTNGLTGSTFGTCTQGAPGCDPSAKRTELDYILTLKPTDTDTVIVEVHYGNETNTVPTTAASGGVGAHSKSGNARWDAVVAYFIHDFNDQTQPNAFSLRLRGELFEDAGGARTCSGVVGVNAGNNTCAGATQFGPATLTPQTIWSPVVTLQYAPVPSLITRTEFAYAKSDKNVFLHGSEPVNNQETLTFNVVYLF